MQERPHVHGGLASSGVWLLDEGGGWDGGVGMQVGIGGAGYEIRWMDETGAAKCRR